MAGVVLSVGLDAVRYLVVVLMTAGLFQAFWKRLAMAIAPVRPLDFQEAIAVILMISILFGR